MSRGGDRDFLKMAYRALGALDADGHLDMATFDELIEIALRDGIFDGDEKRVMRKVLDLVDEDLQSDASRERVAAVRHKYGI